MLKTVIGSVVKTIKGKALNLETVVNAPADEVSVTWLTGLCVFSGLLAKSSLASQHSVSFSLKVTAEFQAGDVLIPEPEAQEVERAAVETPWSVGLGEEGHGTPARSK